MRKICLLYVSLLLLCCSTNKDPLSSQLDDHSYFPLTVGNVWYYDRTISPDNPRVKRIVLEKIEINGNEYHVVSDIYGYDGSNPHTYTDTLRADSEGNIRIYENGQESLLFDFGLETDTTYYYKDYTVRLKHVGSIETPVGTFEDCIELYFDIPKVVDEETRYLFAPGIGLVKRMVGEGPPMVLYSLGFRPLSKGQFWGRGY